MRTKQLLEAKDITIYKRLLRALGDYTTSYPATGIDQLFRKACDKGTKILPKDEQARTIIDTVLTSDCSSSGIIQKLLNLRFADLAVGLRPQAKKGRRKEVAFWAKDDKVSDKIIDLIDFEGKAEGRWVDAEGNKVELLKMEEDTYVAVPG